MHLFLLRYFAFSMLNSCSCFKSKFYPQHNFLLKLQRSITSSTQMSSINSSSNSNNSNKDNMIQRLNMDDIPISSTLIHNGFPSTHSHSWTRALGIESQLENYMKTYLHDPLQFQVGCYGEKRAVDNSNDFKGVIIIEEFEKPHIVVRKHQLLDDKLDHEHLPYDPIDALILECKISFYNELHRRHHLKTEQYKCAYIPWLITDEAYRRQGVAQRLLQHANQQIAAHGYDCAVAICCSPESTRLFEKLGYKLWADIEYTSFPYHDTFPFQVLPDSVNIVVYEFEK